MKRFLTRDARTALLFCFAAAVALAVLYGPHLSEPFLNDWDDGRFVVDNPHLAPTWENVRFFLLHPFETLYIPLPMLSLGLDRLLFGLNPLAFRLHNLCLFLVCGFLLLQILRQLGIRSSIAFSAALLWMLNPQKIESVQWIAERKDLVAGALFLAATFCFVRSLRKGAVPVVAAVLGLLAVCSKPTAFPLPGVLLVAGLCLTHGKPARERLRLLVLPIALPALGIAWAWSVTAQTMPFSLRSSFAVPLHNLFWHPLTAVFPFELSPIYPPIDGFAPYLPMYAGVLFFLILLLAAARFARAPRRCVVAVPLIVLGCMIPVIGLHGETPFAYCDRYNFLPSAAVWCGLALLANALLRRRPRWKRLIPFFFFPLCLFFLLQSMEYVRVWRVPDLFHRALARSEHPSMKLYEMLLGQAMKNEDRELKIFLADSMMRQRDADCYTEKERKALRNLALYLEAHIACLDGDYAFAWDRFSRMNNENPEDDALFEFLMEHFERDLLYAAVWKGDRRTARRALDRLLLRTKPDTPAHRHWTFTKRRLENDVPGQIAVLRLLVKDYPNDARYALILKELDENAETGENFGASEAAKTKPEAADPRSALRREAAP